MNRFWFLIFLLLNSIPVPYRLKRLEKIYREVKNFFARKLFESVGRNATIRPKARLSYLQNISVGNNTSIGDRSMIVAAEKVFIGNNVMMGPEVMILTQNHQITPREKNLIDGGVEKKSITILDDVWIGARVVILPGAKIGTGVVIAAGSVVPGKKFPDYSVIGGNPAKIIRFRE